MSCTSDIEASVILLIKVFSEIPQSGNIGQKVLKPAIRNIH